MTSSRYSQVSAVGHPNAWADGRIYEHVLVMSNKLGRALDAEEQVHHIDHDRRNNDVDNLMLFPNQLEHLSYHARERALAACGNASFMKCRYCKEYDDPTNMHVTKTAQIQAHHKECAIKFRAEPSRKARTALLATARRSTP